jgi:hypothetical protein
MAISEAVNTKFLDKKASNTKGKQSALASSNATRLTLTGFSDNPLKFVHFYLNISSLSYFRTD